MKKTLVLILFSLLLSSAAHCQFMDKMKSKVKNKVSQRLDNKEDRAIDKGLDKTEQGIDNSVKPGTVRNTDNTSSQKDKQVTPVATAPSSAPVVVTFKAYNNYDFIPGNTIIFEDHFTDDQDGEFPAHWNLGAGQGVMNKVDNINALLLTEGNYARVNPLIKSNSYLTDTFTIEFDSYSQGGYGAKLFFYSSGEDAAHANNDIACIDIAAGNSFSGAEISSKISKVSLSGTYPKEISGDGYNGQWHHIAIAYKNKQVKVYVDQYRIVVMPNIGVSPRAFDIEGIGDQKQPIIMANFRVANGGGMNMLGKKFTDAKIVTHGINFDIDKSSIRPESMGTLNMITGILKDNPALKFEVDGHTDNSGDPAHNLTLSRQRADAVKEQLIGMGIDAGRLTTKGFGDSKPVSDNSTPEGKANNRRVEFIRK